MMVFLRRDTQRLSKLGKKRKKKQTWRRPTGRHNKMRLKRRGYPKVVSVGYKKKEKREEIITVTNITHIQNIDPKNKIFRLGKVGTKRKIDLVKAAKEKKITFTGINEKKILAKEKKKPVKKEEKK